MAAKVRVKVQVRVIPEEAYLESLRSDVRFSASRPHPAERRLFEVEEDPENVTIGTFTHKIKARSQRIRRDPLDDIKYLKDGDFHADLDVDMTIYDAFVDAGTAACGGHDQTATMIIVLSNSDRQFALRAGSRVPELDHPKYQLRSLPQPPLFEETPHSLGKLSANQAFLGEAPNDDSSLRGTSATRQRPNVVREDIATAGLAHSIERDLDGPPEKISRRYSKSPVVISETQKSSQQYTPSPQDEGSVILGGDAPKAEPLEVADSIHSVPLAEESGIDLEPKEIFVSTQELTTPKLAGQSKPPAQPGGDSIHHSNSETSSIYHSSVSGPIRSASRGRALDSTSIPSSTENHNRPSSALKGQSPKRRPSDSPTGSSIEGRPITPPSNSSRQRLSKETSESLSHSARYVAVPSSETSRFSSKLRRQDFVPSADLDIRDTQMSPRSRSSYKEKRGQGKFGSIPTREMCGLFYGLGEKQPLVQSGKRQRKDTVWDFTEYIEGLSETDNENYSPNGRHKVQGRVIDDDASKYGQPDHGTDRRSKSRVLPHSIDREPNASLEPVRKVSDSSDISTTEAAKPAQVAKDGDPPSGTDLDHSTASHSESDSENNNHVKEMASRAPADSDREDFGPIPAASLSKGSRAGDDQGDDNLEEICSDPVVEILRKNALDRKESFLDPDHPRSLKKTIDSHKMSSPSSTLPDEARQSSQQRSKDSQNQAEEVSRAQSLESRTEGSYLRCNDRGEAAISSGANEQLSHDLQASLQAGSNVIDFEAKSGGTSNVQRLVSKVKSARNVPSQRVSPSEIKFEALEAPSMERGNNARSIGHEAGRPRESQELAEKEVTLGSDASSGVSHKRKRQDGKIGLGFSQSPPGKRTASRLHSYWSPDSSSNEGGTDNALSMLHTKRKSASLKKSKPVAKLMSSQSGSLNTPTPSQIEQPAKDSRPKNLKALRKTSSVELDVSTTLDMNRNIAVPSVAANGLSEFRSNPPKDPPYKPDGGAGKEDWVSVGTGRKQGLADTAISGMENNSKPASSQSHAQPFTNPKTAKRRRKEVHSEATNLANGSPTRSSDGSSLILPPGFTQDEYLAARANFNRSQPQSLNRRKISTVTRKPAMLAGNHRHTSSPFTATPDPVAAKKLTPKNGVEPRSFSAKATKVTTLMEAADTTDTAKSCLVDKGKEGAAKLAPKPSKKSYPTTASAVGQRKQPIQKTHVKQSTSNPGRSNSTESTPTNTYTRKNKPPKTSTAKPIRTSIDNLVPGNLESLRIKREAERSERAAVAAALKSSTAPPMLVADNGNHVYLSDTESDSSSSTESDSDLSRGYTNGIKEKIARIHAHEARRYRAELDPAIRNHIP